MTDEQLFKRWDALGAKISAKVFPYRWYLLATGAILGLLAGIYF